MSVCWRDSELVRLRRSVWCLESRTLLRGYRPCLQEAGCRLSTSLEVSRHPLEDEMGIVINI